MPLGKAMHQTPGQPGRTVARRGEAESEAVSDDDERSLGPLCHIQGC